MSNPIVHPIVLKSGEGEFVALKSDRLTWKLDSSQSGGALSIIERVVAPKFESPPQEHAHTREDWGYYVLEGRIGVRLDCVEHQLEKGSFVWVPRGTFFRWWNPDDQAARVLAFYAPGAFASFFKEVLPLIARKAEQVDDYGATLKDIIAIQDRYGMVRKKTESL